MQELRDPDARPSPETISIKYRNSKFRIPIAALGNDGKSKEKEKKKAKASDCRRNVTRVMKNNSKKKLEKCGSWSPKIYIHIFMISNFC